MPPSHEPACGGVVFDAHGRVLLRRPANLFGGYTWTFPKGRPEHGETAEQAALREVREETGVEAEIVLRLPAEYAGSIGVATIFFVMRFVAVRGPFDDDETEAVAWATQDGARAMIAESRVMSGRVRDTQVLHDALAAWQAACGRSS